MFKKGIELLGNDDAQLWWSENKDVFTHPNFIQRRVVLAPHCIDGVMKREKYDDTTVWAHTHPWWDSKFGVYIVRVGKEVIYEGRDIDKVREYLGIDT